MNTDKFGPTLIIAGSILAFAAIACAGWAQAADRTALTKRAHEMLVIAAEETGYSLRGVTLAIHFDTACAIHEKFFANPTCAAVAADPSMPTAVAYTYGTTQLQHLVLADDTEVGDRSDSLLFHEMVHVLQYASGKKFACVAEMEREAYDAQITWLKSIDAPLERFSELPGPLLLAVLTSCRSD